MFSLEKREKGLKRNNCQKKLLEKDENYTNYKEALNAATTEIRQTKRRYEQK